MYDLAALTAYKLFRPKIPLIQLYTDPLVMRGSRNDAKLASNGDVFVYF